MVSKSAGQVKDYIVSTFAGLNTSIKDIKTLPKGVSPDSLNWITGRDGDHIELRRGQALLGQTRLSGVGYVSGLGVGIRYDGTQIPFYAIPFGQPAIIASNTNAYAQGIGGDQQFSMAFTVTTTLKLSTLSAFIGKTIDTSILNAKIYNITGTPGSSALPTGVALANSDDFDSSSLLGDSPVVKASVFNFSGINQITLTPGNYAVTIEGSIPQFFWDQSDAAATGYVAYADGGVWTNTTGKFLFTLNGGTIASTLKYYDPVANDVSVIGNNLLPAASDGDDFSIVNYQGLAGSFMYASSKNSSIYKIPVANPGSPVDLLQQTYRGKIKAGQGRLFLWDRSGTTGDDKTGLYLSYLDHALLSGFTQRTTGTIATTASKTYFGTLGMKSIQVCTIDIANPALIHLTAHGLSNGDNVSFATTGALPTGISTGTRYYVISAATDTFQIALTPGGSAVITTGTQSGVQSVNLRPLDTCMYTQFTCPISGGTEVMIDDRNGNLKSPAGGTGTINYATGVYSMTFFNQPTTPANITVAYFIEDSTNTGICDFSYSATRTAGQGNTFRQDDGGGNLQAVWPINTIEYCFHILKTWQVNLTNTDTNSTNLPYRSLVGIPFFRAAYPVSDGILYMDYTKPNEPVIRKLTVSLQDSTNIIPVSLSDQLDLSSYDFSKCLMFQFGDYDIMCCANIQNGIADTFNGVMFIRNNLDGKGWWDKLDYDVSCLDIYNGSLLSGDSLSNNLMTLFSGFDDDGQTINNYWTSGETNLDITGIKKTHRMKVEGLTQKTQKTDVLISLDGGNFTKVFTIDGSNTKYVDTGKATSIGSYTSGSKIIGGGGIASAYPFNVEFHINTDYYEYIRVKFQSTDIGYVQINEYTFKDNRYKGRHSLPNKTF